MNIGSVSSIGSGNFTYGMGQTSRMQNQQLDPSEFVARLLEKEDSNGDGVIGPDESRLDYTRFGELDTDGSGTLTTEELTASLETFGNMPPPPMGHRMPPPPPGDSSEMASAIMEQDDANGDGLISVDEAAVGSDIFEEIDTDGDGSLTIEELESHFEAMQPDMEEQGSSPFNVSGAFGSDMSSDSMLSLFDIMKQSEASSAYGSQSQFGYAQNSLAQKLALSA